MPNRDYSLHGVISRLAADPGTREDVALLVTACHRMGIAYLRVKSSGGHFSPEHFGLTHEDLAFDCIADLFTRDDDGTFPVIKTFVARISTSGEGTEMVLENALRRFVCSLVNRRVFELYRQFDPSLAKVIRNIKLAALTHPDMKLSDHLGEKVLVPRRASRLNTHLPVIAPELLLSDLMAGLRTSKTLKHLMTVLAEVLSEQDLYRRLVPVTQAAIVVRSTLAPTVPAAEEDGGQPDLTEEDIRRMVDRTIHLLKQDKGPAYLRRGRLTEPELDGHMSALRDVLLREFSDPGMDHLSYFDFLHRHIAELTPAEYATKHRSILEYFMRCAKTTVTEYLETGF